MKHFEELLRTLGATDVQLLRENAAWDFWKVEYQTPIEKVCGYYLYLKSKCSNKEANRNNILAWNSLAGPNKYEIVLPPKSPLANNKQKTMENFKGKRIKTSSKLLKDSFLKDISIKKVITEEYFIDPDIQLESQEKIHNGTEHLTAWLLDKEHGTKQAQIGILVANGGVGKTTVSRQLSNNIHKVNPNAFPLLIEADQWRGLSKDTLTLDKLWDIAITNRFDRPSRLLSNETALKVLIQEGLFIVIFDGFDELCVNDISAQSVIDELHALVSTEDNEINAKILLTARETYWKSIADEINLEKIEIFRINEFDNDQRKRYFENRLSDPSERDNALRIAREISGRLYESVQIEESNTNRPSGVPFILDLIAQYVQNNNETDFTPYKGDHLENLLIGLCRRENIRQKLNIPPEKQLLFFEELFRENQVSINFEDLKLYLEVICETDSLDIAKRMTNHVFLQMISPNQYQPKYEVLRVYFVARFLAKGLSNIFNGQNTRKKIFEKLAENHTGTTQVMDWLVNQLNMMEKQRLNEAIRHADRLLKDEPNQQASMALFHLIMKLMPSQNDKIERTNYLFDCLNGSHRENNFVLENTTLTGLIKTIDFSNYTFKNCTFVDVDIKNCNFNDKTVIVKSRFIGTVSIISCKDGEKITFEDCKCSPEAEYWINEFTKKQNRTDLKNQFAEEALIRALKKFRRDFGFIGIQYRYRSNGIKISNPFRDKIWEALEKNDIIERHQITNVELGGIHIKDNPIIHKEITNYLDNAVLGKNLKGVITELIN